MEDLEDGTKAEAEAIKANARKVFMVSSVNAKGFVACGGLSGRRSRGDGRPAPAFHLLWPFLRRHSAAGYLSN